MTPNCTHPLENGKPCTAPAINGSKFCRHHDPQRPPRPVQEQLAPDTEPLLLPQILDKRSALVALNVVVQALAEGRIKRSAAQTFLSAIKFAVRMIEEISEAGEAVQPAAISPRPATVALAASSASRKAADPVLTKLPRYAYQDGIDPSTARIVKELLAQSHRFPTVQPGISRL